MGTIRNNLLTQKDYTPYCGGIFCSVSPRTEFNGEQFTCHCCGFRTSFETEFIEKYKKKWNK